MSRGSTEHDRPRRERWARLQRLDPLERAPVEAEPGRISAERVRGHFSALKLVIDGAKATGPRGAELELCDAFSWVATAARRTHEHGHKLIFIGNGGSAAIASHLAIDASKNGNLRSITLSDSAALTCLGNDLGYENVFSHQIEMHAVRGDLLIAISSSGQSENILRAARAARKRRCQVVTLSGFERDNPLRELGQVNFYADSPEYGLVEVTHLALLHAILDLAQPGDGRA